MKKYLLAALMGFAGLIVSAQGPIRFDSKPFHQGTADWKMARFQDIREGGEKLSDPAFDDASWMEAIVPGTVLNTLVYNKVYPEPYYGLNNRRGGAIPDLSEAGRDFYTAWFRTEFDLPESYRGKNIWLRLEGINYRSEVWVNGSLLATTGGMFKEERVNITDYSRPGQRNALAIKVLPVDVPGKPMLKPWGAPGEFHNGGDGAIGLNTTMLMSVGWDFTFMDGVRDRNTGIWKGVSIYTTGPIEMLWPVIRSTLDKPGFDRSREQVGVTLVNPSIEMAPVPVTVKGEIVGEGITFEKDVLVNRGEQLEVSFTPEEYAQLIIDNPRLWWPVNKGPQNLYKLKLSAFVNGTLSDSVSTVFGIRDIVSDCNTPDGSRQFYVNGKRIFVRGSNWIPEGMLRMTPERTAAELRYTRQCGINLIRLWGGGIEESADFYRLCDEYGIMIWQEFWVTGDTQHPQDQDMYRANVASTIRRIRNHPALAYYVDSNESYEVSGVRELIERLDGTRGYQVQSECCGIHDGSPYKQVNPMRHYENTASERGSRVDGFNPEYGSPCIPTAEVLREIMDEKDLWPINKEVWDYLDGDGFLYMTTLYKELTDHYGESSSIEEYCQKGQFLGAMNMKSIWDVWNYNKLDYGDRYCAGTLFWHHNSPIRRVGAMMWDWSLEPMASLYATMHSLEPLHPMYDYLKNTVSVSNDYYRSFSGYTVKAQVYDIRSRKVWERSARIDIPEDGVVNDVIRVDFPAGISQVHFIKLYLYDAAGKVVADNFYWRSNDRYEGWNTSTGPCASGFESLRNLATVKMKYTWKLRCENGKHFVDITLKNTSHGISFFNRIELLDKELVPVRPSFYDDNFFSLMPGETKSVTIETADAHTGNGLILRLSGWNAETKSFTVK